MAHNPSPHRVYSFFAFFIVSIILYIASLSVWREGGRSTHVTRCNGSSPLEHINWVSQGNCPCSSAYGVRACLCQLPKSSGDDYSCTLVPAASPRASLLAVFLTRQLVSNSFYSSFKGLSDGSMHPPSAGACRAVTMMGQRRLDNLRWLLEDVIMRRVKGDFIETGAWKGGGCMLAGM
jgi:hypothetical protein